MLSVADHENCILNTCFPTLRLPERLQIVLTTRFRLITSETVALGIQTHPESLHLLKNTQNDNTSIDKIKFLLLTLHEKIFESHTVSSPPK
jgi:hypothetical protein